jgi:acetyl-CoA carboxylase biotin carboxyl carrier protein
VEGVRALADLCWRAGVHELEASAGPWSVRLQFDVSTTAPLAAPPEAPTPAPPAEQLHVLRSEWVGLFHRGIDPDAQPLVLEGQQVREGDVVGLIEAMQLLHEQRADREGTIVRFLLEDNDPVEYGQPILELR